MTRWKRPGRMAYDLCPETCPAVDRILDALIEDLRLLIEDPQDQRHMEHLVDFCRKHVKKDGTEKLRTALEEACGMYLEACEERDALQHELDKVSQ